MLNRKLGKYEIIDRLGRGGMAEVFRAYHTSLDRYVAIKILHPFLAEDAEFKSRFEKEAQNVARLKHPHIVQVYDFDYDAETERYYMVMEYIDGPTLKDRLMELGEKGRRLPVPEVLRVTQEAARALAYAHAHNMIHRDVKPANLMLDQGKRVVLTDFGIAKIVSGPQHTVTGSMIGTPAYMAPEQGMGGTGDERSDLYSLGVILYEMCTGSLPFNAETPVAMILKHLHDPIPVLSELLPSLPKELDTILARLMAKDPGDRYQTATELIGDLGRLELNQEPIATLPVKPITPLKPPESIEDHTTVIVKPKSETPAVPRRPASSPSRPKRIPLWALGGSIAAMVFVTISSFFLGAKSREIGLLPSHTPSVTTTQTATPSTTHTSTWTITPSLTSTWTPTSTVTSTATHTPTATATPTATSTEAPTKMPTPSPDFTQTVVVAQTATTAACKYDYAVVESDPADGEKGGFFKANSEYERKITLLNTGSCAWEPNTSLTFLEGEDFNAGPRLFIRERVNPSETVVLTFRGVLPSKGSLQPFSGTWELRTPGQIPIGIPLVISILVYEDAS